MNRERDTILKGCVKRIGITILCCIPFMVIIGYILRNTHSAVTIAIFVVFMLVAVCIEEYIHIKLFTKKQLMRKALNKDEDVFK